MAFKIIPHEETEWGTFFACVDEDHPDKIVFVDRFVLAQMRCDELNEDTSGRPN